MKKARTLQDIKDHPAVRFVDKESNGYWIYLKDGWYNSQLEGLLIHESTVKACCEILNQHVTESAESTEDVTEATEATEATTAQIVDTNSNLSAVQRQWMISQIIDSMLETVFIPDSEEQINEQTAWLTRLTDANLVYEFAGWNPGAIVD